MAKQESNPGAVIATLSAVLLAGAIAVGWWVSRGGPTMVARPESSTQERKLAASNGVPEIRLLPDGRLDPDTEKQIREMAHARTAAMLEEYFALPEGEARKDYLDKKIDEQESMRKMVEGFTTTQPSTQPADGSPRRIMLHGGQSPQALKDFSETVPAEVQARLAEYIRDMNARRAERGLPPGGGVMRVIRLAN
jgi:hypothetical protein